MTKGRRGLASAVAALVAAALSFSSGARAQSSIAAASATIVQPVGVGVTFDIVSRLLTAVSVTGQADQAVTLAFASRNVADQATLPGLNAVREERGVFVLSSQTVSISLEQLDVAPAPDNTRKKQAGAELMLAQFN